MKSFIIIMISIMLLSCSTNDTTRNKSTEYKNKDQLYGQDDGKTAHETNRLDNENKLLLKETKTKQSNEEKFISNYMRNLKKNLDLSYKEFDQTPNKGWRAYFVIGDNISALKLIEAYIKEHEKTLKAFELRNLYLHLGQLYAFTDNYKDAIKTLPLALDKDDTINMEWNNYIKGLIAFLSHDLEKLKSHKDGVIKSLEYISKLNMLIKNYNKPYSGFAQIKLVK